MTTLIIGATGATGTALVQLLLRDVHYAKIVVFVHKPNGIIHRKLLEVLTDFNKLEDVSEFIAGNIWFSCLGTMREAAGSTNAQWRIDDEVPVSFAQIAKRNGVTMAVLVSTYGASANSTAFLQR